ncbi:MAG TPA: HAMP domain-containing sensor histidine kinase [Polyangiaceae bacterium]
MQPDDHFPESPSQPRASVLRDQLEANEQLVLAALRAQEDAEAARSGRVTAESESDQLRAAAQFRERLLGIIGHDLRNPLNSIVVAAQLLAEGNNLPGRGAWLASRIIESGQRMGRMIDQLANFTRARSGGGFELELVPCDLAHICRDVIDELQLGSPRQIRLAIEGNVCGTWDRDRIAEVLSNLMSNALDHAATSTAVLVRAREDNGWVVAEVENEGASIAPDLVDSIFNAFRRTRADVQREAGHLGLGLYISREIALAHGGSLEVESATGRTTFTLRVPRVPPA